MHSSLTVLICFEKRWKEYKSTFALSKDSCDKFQVSFRNQYESGWKCLVIYCPSWRASLKPKKNSGLWGSIAVFGWCVQYIHIMFGAHLPLALLAWFISKCSIGCKWWFPSSWLQIGALKTKLWSASHQLRATTESGERLVQTSSVLTGLLSDFYW